MLIAEGAGVRVHAIEAGSFRVDGGGMFGAVPKSSWVRVAKPDPENRVELAMRCLLVETPRCRILIDTGAGNRGSAPFRDLYGIENDGSPTRLEDSLRAAGCDPDRIDVVVNTHLHFDHAGGNSLERPDGAPTLSFSNAEYAIQRGEWDAAHTNNLFAGAGYRPEDLGPLEATGALAFMHGDTEIAPGVRAVVTPGHTAHHQSVLVDAGEDTVFLPADLVPTAAHVRPAWIMSYDLEPLTTLSEKVRWLAQAGREGWLIVFGHDPLVVAARAVPADDGHGCDLGRLTSIDDRQGAG